MRSWIFLFLIVVLLAGIDLSAQNPYIQHYTTFDGLPTNMVYYVYQDSKKFIWFATNAGVVRYDGTNFTNYRKNDGLSSNEVIRIKEDSFGRLWFFNLNGTLNYFHYNKIFNGYNAPFLDSLKNHEFFRNFFQDVDKTIYFYYNHNRDIFALDSGNHVKKFKLEPIPRKKMGLPWEGMVTRFIGKASTGEFLIWTRIGLFKLKNFCEKPTIVSDTMILYEAYPARNKTCYFALVLNADSCITDSRNARIELVKMTNEFPARTVILPFRSDLPYTSVLEDNDGFLWVATFDQGVFCLKNNRIIHHFDIQEAQSLMQDHENNIWVSSMKDGVYKINPNLILHSHFDISIFQDKGIIALSPDLTHGLWLTNGKMIYLFMNNYFYALNFKNKNNSFNFLCFLKNKKLIAGEKSLNYYAFENLKPDTLNGKIKYNNSATTSFNFKNIAVNNTGEELSACAQFFLFIFSPDKLFRDIKQANIGERIYTTFYNSNNDLIINAKKNYIFRNNSLVPCKELSRFENKIITDHIILNNITELYNIEGDSLYLSNKDKMFNLTSAFGIPVDLQIKKVVYEEPTLYLSTFRNIYRCDNPLNVLKDKPVQLQLIDINFRNIHDILVINDSLYIASDDGLTIIPEALLRKITTNTPLPYFQSVLVNDKEADPSQQNLMLTGNNKIKFIFSSINYSSTPVVYSYRLEGSDPGWSTAKGRIVVYQNLPAGNYVFKLRTSKPNSEWSKTIEYKITIKAHFWQHPLFISGLLLIFLTLIFLAIIGRKNILMKRRELDQQLITLEQKALQSMMNPHFIFNSLGSIQNYLLQKKSGEAGLYLSQFARLIRQNLNAINAASINLEEEIDRLKNYLDLEKMRMDNKFEYLINVDDDVEADEIQIPSMIIQPFVENAIWHGISSIDEKGEIIIKFRMRDEKSLMVFIEDNGIGMKRSETYSTTSEKHIHLGLEMTRKRLEILGKKFSVKTAIEFSETSPGLPNPGTRIVVVVPFTYSQEAS